MWVTPTKNIKNKSCKSLYYRHFHNFYLWRRRRDLNPRASYPTYTLSRGASSPLEYFSKGDYYKIFVQRYASNDLFFLAERVGFEPTVPFGITGFQDQLLKPLGHLSTNILFSCRLRRYLFYHI